MSHLAKESGSFKYLMMYFSKLDYVVIQDSNASCHIHMDAVWGKV